MRTPALTRRQLLRAGGTIAGLQMVAPIALRAGRAWGVTTPDPATALRRRLVLVDLGGGNDGLNTVVPMDGAIRDVYDKVRTSATNLPRTSLRALGSTNGGDVGLNPYLPTVHSLWQAGRVAVVQGVDYPKHNYSHFVSEDIWMSGEPVGAPDSGWLGRHFDRVGIGPGEVRGVGVGYDRLPLGLRGMTRLGEEINNLGETQFLDGGQTGTYAKRHDAFAGYDAATAPVEHTYGENARKAVDLAIACTGLKAAQPGELLNEMLTARKLLEQNLGVEVVVVRANGYDTHDFQASRHQTLMTRLDRAIEAFFLGTSSGSPILLDGLPIGPLDAGVADRTLVMTFSEFGRRIGDNASGTDHGAAAPCLLIGPPAPAAGSGLPSLVPGLHGDHPSMGTVALPADNLAMTTDFRSIYQAILQSWLNDPAAATPDEGDPLFASIGPLAGLFGTA